MSIFSRFRKKINEDFSIASGSAPLSSLLTKPDALGNSAFWSCIINLSRLYATLPLKAYETMKDGSRMPVDKNRPLPVLLANPNPYMTSYQFLFYMGFNFELHGEAVAIIERSRAGIPLYLWPVSPNQVLAHWKNDKLVYTVSPEGKTYPASDILIISNTPSGYTNVLSPIRYANDDLDLEVKCKQMQKEFYEGASVIGNTISVPSNFNTEQKDEVRSLFKSAKKYRNLVLDERIKVTPIQIASNDISKLETASKWNVAEVARRFNVPPFMVGDTTGTYNNSEQQGIVMVTYCLQPRVTAWEAALDSKLAYAGQYFKFNLSSLMRGDHATRAAYYHNGIMDGWLSVNDILLKEDMPKIGPEGDEHFFPMNYGTLKDIVAGKYASQPSPWDIPTEKKQNPDDIRESAISERRARDLRFLEAAKAPVRTSRKKLEKMIRAQIKKEIAKIRSLVATGQSTENVLKEFNEWLNENAAELQPQYKALYLDVIKRMLPVVAKEIGSDKEVDESRMEGFADSYATSLMGRHTGYVYKRISQSIGTEDFEQTADDLSNDLPISESSEEVNRSSNAFNVFLYGALGLQFMHVVAAADSCSFCGKIDGKTCKVDGYVLDKGTDVDDGEGNVRHIQKSYRHPPFHTHCECGVAPGKGD